MKKTMGLEFGIMLMFAMPAMGAMLPVCERTEAVKVFLEGITKKTCDQITEADLEPIKRVAVANRGIVEFKAGDFSGLPNLEILNIKGNLNTTFPEGMTKDLTKLKTIVLFGSRNLRFLPHDFLEGNEQLENLHMFSDPNLKSLSESVFARLGAMQNLKVLDLDADLNPAEVNRHKQLFPIGGTVELNLI